MALRLISLICVYLAKAFWYGLAKFLADKAHQTYLTANE